MRVLVIKTDENNNKTGIRFMPYNTEEDKKNCYAFINENQVHDFETGKFNTYSKTDIGFDVYMVPSNESSNDRIDGFLKENPEYSTDRYTKRIFNTPKGTGIAVFKKWEDVDTARKYKIIKPLIYELICEADRQKIPIKIESMGALKNDELLYKISQNIVKEIKNDNRIADMLRLGETRKKENKIAYKNWLSEEGNIYNSITFQNGGQAFSVLFDTDMNFLKAQYNSHIFQDGKTWTPIDEVENPKECLMAIFNKMSEMEFNEWLADMGENKKYTEIKTELKNVIPEAVVSEYFPLKQLGNGYFTVTYKDMQLAIEIKEDEVISGYKYRTMEDNRIKGKWLDECPNPEHELCQVVTQLSFDGHISTLADSIYDLKLNMLDDMLASIRSDIESIGNKNELEIDKKLNMLLNQTSMAKQIFNLQKTISIPIEIIDEEEIETQEER